MKSSVLLTSVIFGFTTAASAEVVVYLNPQGAENYDWVSSGPDDLSRWLDVTLPASAQPAPGSGPSSYIQQQNYEQLASRIDTFTTGVTEMQCGGVHPAFVWSSTAGDMIPAEAPLPAGFSWNDTGFVSFPTVGSNIPEGVEAFLGIRFDLGSGWQYGWIGVVRTGIELDTFAWGYETEPGVPIAAGAGLDNTPCPGDLAGDDDLVNVNDLLDLFANWGACADPCPADLADENNVVDVNDLLALFAAWGAC